MGTPTQLEPGALPLVRPQQTLTLDAHKSLSLVDSLMLPVFAKMNPCCALRMSAELDPNPHYRG